MSFASRTHLWPSVLLTAGVACSATKPTPAGGGCLLTTDCQDGLVCVKQRCSSDLSGIVNIEDAAARLPQVPPGDDGGADAGGSADSAGDDAGDASAPGAESADDATPDVGALE
jgi:hypothetical protein